MQYHIEGIQTLELLLGKQISLLDPIVRLFVGNNASGLQILLACLVCLVYQRIPG
jgi:hypothetical protein